CILADAGFINPALIRCLQNPEEIAAYYTAGANEPTASRTAANSDCAIRAKLCTTAESNCVPLDSFSRRSASSRGKPSRYGREETIASNASITETILAPIGISEPRSLAGYPVPSKFS